MCDLHILYTNELTLKHLFSEIDGRISGTDIYTGTTGKAIQENVNEYPLVEFNKIHGKITESLLIIVKI